MDTDKTHIEENIEPDAAHQVSDGDDLDVLMPVDTSASQPEDQSDLAERILRDDGRSPQERLLDELDPDRLLNSATGDPNNSASLTSEPPAGA